MKKLGAMLVLLMAVSPVWAEGCKDKESSLNKVVLSLNAEQWLTTKTAVVTVEVSAAVADQGVEKIRSNVMQKLQQLAAKGEWHILSFNRQKDRSGLESIEIRAEARLEQADLNGLRDKAKAISKPGETFKINNIQFTPSDAEVRAANEALRKNVYQQAKAEVDALNSLYPSQKYYLHKIDFVMGLTGMKCMVSSNRMATLAAVPGAAPAMPIGNKAELTATVEIASQEPVPAKAQ